MSGDLRSALAQWFNGGGEPPDEHDFSCADDLMRFIADHLAGASHIDLADWSGVVAVPSAVEVNGDRFWHLDPVVDPELIQRVVDGDGDALAELLGVCPEATP